MRTDNGGMFWDTFFDVVSLAVSIVDVIQNPSDPWAWAGLVGDAVDVLIPVVSGVGEVTDAIRVANKIDNAHDAAKNIERGGKVAELHRPYIRKSVRKEVEANAMKNADGLFLDVNTREAITGKYDLGHKAGFEFKKMKKEAMEKGWTQKQFNDYMNNPDFYQIELPHNNRSHRYELP